MAPINYTRILASLEYLSTNQQKGLRDKLCEILGETNYRQLKSQIGKLEQQINGLKDQLADTKLRFAGAKGAGSGGIEAILTEVQKEREAHREEIRQKDLQLEAFRELFEHHMPPMNTAFPYIARLREVGGLVFTNWPFPAFITETPPEETREELEAQNPNTIMVTSDEAIYLGITLSVFDQQGNQVRSGQILNESVLFPGSVEQARQIIPHIRSMLNLSPTPRELAVRGMLNFYRKNNKDTIDMALLNAMYKIASIYYIDHAAESHYDSVCEGVFNTDIKPVLPQNLTPNEISDVWKSFTETVKATFNNVINYRWQQPTNPRRLKPGPKGK